MRALTLSLIVFGFCLAFSAEAMAAGTLKPAKSADAQGHDLSRRSGSIRITDHQVDVQVTDGFARVEVSQQFHNPNDRPTEAIYRCPVPESGALSEMSIWVGERALHGEVLPRDEAVAVYEQERKAGRKAGLATKESYRAYEFAVSAIAPNETVRVRFVYYQPLKIEAGVGRFHYPLQDGGTDDARAQAFWVGNEQVEGRFSARVDLRSSSPIAAVHSPDGRVAVKQVGKGHYSAAMSAENIKLDQDLVVYYRLAEAPGGVELLTHRPDPKKPGTFLLTLTPGVDLKPLTGGADYVFVLDTSGSMKSKIERLLQGVEQAIGQLQPHDRFRVIAFSGRPTDLLGGYVKATPTAVREAIGRIRGLRAEGGTDLFSAMAAALKGLEEERTTSLVLVTDAVANSGVISPARFAELLKKQDVRVFGFLMGNGANWPLMELVTQVSGGFYARVSNADDVVGQLALAKAKVRTEALHDVKLRIEGVKVSKTTRMELKKLYAGEQLAIFGRYEGHGEARVTLSARVSGEPRKWRTSFDFPAQAKGLPQLERLWAMQRVQVIEAGMSIGQVKEKKGAKAIERLGVRYQLVTDETAMVVLSDERFAKRGIKRRNARRVANEQAAPSKGKGTRPSRQTAPMFSRGKNRPARSYRLPRGGGGGAVDPLMVIGLFGLIAVGVRRRK